jgi:hypothetical protein
VIEASFDRAEAYERLADFEHALEWLDRAAALSGGLSAGYRAQRARWARAAAVRPAPAAGDWKNRFARSPRHLRAAQPWAGGRRERSGREDDHLPPHRSPGTWADE